MGIKELEQELENLENPCDKCKFLKRLLCVFNCSEFDSYDKRYDEIVFKIRDSEDYQKRLWEIKFDKFYKD